MDEMDQLEDCRNRYQRMGGRTAVGQSIFNVIVGVGLILICLSLIFKFYQIDNNLEGFQVGQINPGSEYSDPFKFETGIEGPGSEYYSGEPGIQGPPGSAGPKGESVEDQVPILASCDALKKSGVGFSGIYQIDPDGPVTGLDPFSVVCDMTSDLIMGYTTIHHDKEEDGNVNNAETHGSFIVDIAYDLESEQIKAIKNISSSCRQFIKYACIGSLFQDGHHFWLSVDGEQMVNWGGVPTGTKGCACWMTKTCDDVSKRCNCDVNDAVPRVDQGYLTDKATLPVSQLRFGDTGGVGEKGVYTLGPLQCA